MAIAGHLTRYAEFARLLATYGRAPLSLDRQGADHPAEATAATAEAFARDLEGLGPTFIKLGQLLSSRADLLQPEYAAALERLQDGVAPFPYEEAVAILEDDLHVRLSKAFTQFERAPIAAASLGQVHRAVLRDGRRVAVKIQRPHVRERVLEDLDALDELTHALERFSGTTRHLDVAGLLEEFRRTILRELDYREESRNLIAIAHQLRHFERVRVPLPLDDFTSTRILTMEYIEGTKITQVSPIEWTEIDGEELANDLFRAYLQQVLVDGVFHADPHPGNVLLTPDHHLGLLDLGMVGRLSSRVQEQLFRLLLAIADSRNDDAATVVIALGDKLDPFDEPRVRHSIVELVGRHAHTKAKDLQVGRVMLDISRSGHHYGLKLPSELALLGKTLLHLDEIGRLLDPDFEVNASMRRNAMSLMRRRALKSLTPSRTFSSALEVRELAERLPARMNRILESLAGNNLRLKVEVIDQGSIIDGLQKVANRIALGLVLAALILGAAMLMRVPTAFTIFGYPGLAIVLFLAAAGGGLWLAWSVLAGDVKRTRVR